MSLFVRLWIVATLTAFASAAAAVAAFSVITERSAEVRETDQALTIAQMVAHAIAGDPLPRSTDAVDGLMRQRVDGLMATGRLLSLAVVGDDGRVIADLTPPGLEDDSVLRRLPAGLMSELVDGQRRHLHRAEAAVYLVLPLVDRREQVLGAIGVGIPVQILRDGNDEIATFAGSAAAIAVVLGLIAALVLTRQVAAPVRRLAEFSDRLDDAGFDTSRVADLIDRRDEIGQLTRVMLRLVRALDHLGREMDASIERRTEEHDGG